MQGGNADVPDMKEQERKKNLFDVIYIQDYDIEEHEEMNRCCM